MPTTHSPRKKRDASSKYHNVPSVSAAVTKKLNAIGEAGEAAAAAGFFVVDRRHPVEINYK
jgi:hypothetical protein